LTPGGIAYTYNGQNRLASVSGHAQNGESGSYTYDPSGNLTVDGRGAMYTYTAFDMLDTATVAGVPTTYRYDGDNLRKLRVGSTGTTFFIQGTGGQLLSEYAQPAGASAAQWVRDYVYLGSRLVASFRPPSRATFAQAASTAAEGDVHAVTVTLRSALTAELTVRYATVAGTASAATDFTAISGDLVFPTGSPSGTTRTLTVPILRDRESEATRRSRSNCAMPQRVPSWRRTRSRSRTCR
jgi:YD repeat-containing protein